MTATDDMVRKAAEEIVATRTDHFCDDVDALASIIRTHLADALEDVERYQVALKVIAGGMTDAFPGAPELTEADIFSDATKTSLSIIRTHAWKAKMWGWSQRVAKAAIDAARGEESG
jgi:hypothetical protein